jgi:hypothetical protein
MVTFWDLVGRPKEAGDVPLNGAGAVGEGGCYPERKEAFLEYEQIYQRAKNYFQEVTSDGNHFHNPWRRPLF